MTTYVLGTLEVRLTGREASRNKTRRGQAHTEVLIEVEPVDEHGPTWKKWVRLSELYEVAQPTNQSEDT